MKELKKRVEDLNQNGLHRYIPSYEPLGPTHVRQGAHVYLLLCSNNYLGLTHEETVKKAAIKAVETYGTGAGGARLINGSHPLFQELERKIACFKKTEAALVFNTGYMANVGIISALMNRPGDVIFSDAFNHASIIDGCRLAKGKCVVFPHNDVKTLRELLDKTPCSGKRLIVIDGVFSMDGDLAPLDKIVEIAGKYEAMVMTDDAHAAGVLGNGRGSAAHFGLEDRVAVQVGTMSKAIGAEGAYVAGSKVLIDYLANTARSFIFSTALSPAVIAAAGASFNLLQKDLSRVERLLENAAFMRSELKRLGAEVKEGITPIIPLLVGEAKAAVKVSEKLKLRGIIVGAIRPPTVPEGKSRLRVTVCSEHTKEELAWAAQEIAFVLHDLKEA